MRRVLDLSKRHSVAGSILPSGSEKTPQHEDDTATTSGADDTASTTALVANTAPVLPPNLKVKRVDYYYSRWSKAWKYKNMGDKVTAEMAPIGGSSGSNDQWQQYCFVVVRTLPRKEEQEPTFSVIVKSSYLIQACKNVIKYVPGLSWNADPVTVSP